jgi:hypothetical protein
MKKEKVQSLTNMTTKKLLNRIDCISIENRLTSIEERLGALKELYFTKFENLDRATEAARLSVDKRLEIMNEFRGALKDQLALFITRQEHRPYEEELTALREFRAKLEGVATMKSVYLAYIISSLGLVLSLILGY